MNSGIGISDVAERSVPGPEPGLCGTLWRPVPTPGDGSRVSDKESTQEHVGRMHYWGLSTRDLCDYVWRNVHHAPQKKLKFSTSLIKSGPVSDEDAAAAIQSAWRPHTGVTGTQAKVQTHHASISFLPTSVGFPSCSLFIHVHSRCAVVMQEEDWVHVCGTCHAFAKKI